MKVLVTGATGFIGRHLVPRLQDAGFEVRATVRQAADLQCEMSIVGDIDEATDWSGVLQDAEVVVHLAGRAQADTSRSSQKAEDDYYSVNAGATRSLAEQATQSGVKQFFLMSSAHAVAAESDEAITAQSQAFPVSAYGRSKLAAEIGTLRAMAGSECACTILRPPAVYGCGNTANFDKLLKLVQTGIPLPFASVRNRRSFIYVENLVDLIVKCLGNPKAFGRIFLPSDGEDVSMPELIRAIARAHADVVHGAWSMERGVGGGVAGEGWRVAGQSKRKTEPDQKETGVYSANSPTTSHPSPATSGEARLFPFPESVLKHLGRLPGLGALRKLTSSLYVDSGPVRRDLGWAPPFTMEEGLRRTLMPRPTTPKALASDRHPEKEAEGSGLHVERTHSTHNSDFWLDSPK